MLTAPTSEAIIEILEAAYRVTLPEEQWMDGVLSACSPGLTFGMGTFGYVFDATGPTLSVGRVRSVPRAEAVEGAMRAMLDNVPREYVERTWLGSPCGLASEVPGTEEILAAAQAPYRDIFAVNGYDPSGRGFWVGTPLQKRGVSDTPALEAWTRVAAHLAAAYRLRRRLEVSDDVTRGADAVARPDGVIAHAEGDAREESARTMLAHAVVAVDRARTKEGRRDEGAVRSWRALVGARWSLVDHFDADGRRYVVVRTNRPHERRAGGLTDREWQALAFLAIGHSTKVTAFELGISEATVRVLLLRAMRKLQVRTREEAIARFRALDESTK